jgi:hypothetical protein
MREKRSGGSDEGKAKRNRLFRGRRGLFILLHWVWFLFHRVGRFFFLLASVLKSRMVWKKREIIGAMRKQKG